MGEAVCGGEGVGWARRQTHPVAAPTIPPLPCPVRGGRAFLLLSKRDAPGLGRHGNLLIPIERRRSYGDSAARQNQSLVFDRLRTRAHFRGLHFLKREDAKFSHQCVKIFITHGKNAQLIAKLDGKLHYLKQFVP